MDTRIQIKKGIVYFSLILILLTSILNSRYVFSVFNIPLIILRILTVLMYLPFFISIMWKIIVDIKKRKIDRIDFLFYGFMIYYIIVSIYRIIAGMNYKDSIYDTLTILGTISFLMIYKNDYTYFNKIIISYCGLLIFYRLIYILFFSKIILVSPINTNVIGCVFLISLPIFIKNYINSENLKNKILMLIGSTMMISILFTLGSRFCFFFCIVEIIVLLIKFVSLKKFRDYIFLILISISLILIMYISNIGNAKLNIDRQTNPLFELLTTYTQNINNSTNKLVSTNQSLKYVQAKSANNIVVHMNNVNINDYNKTHSNIIYISSSVNDTDKWIDDQIEQSDQMRRQLMEKGISEIKKNPLFGTGNLYFEYDLHNGYGVFRQTSHNLIIDGIINYGLIGFAILIVLFLKIVFFGIFTYIQKIQYFEFLLIVFAFFGNSLIQSLAYNPIVLPIFVLNILSFGDLNEE